jgi:hypothetical protein
MHSRAPNQVAARNSHHAWQLTVYENTNIIIAGCARTATEAEKRSVSLRFSRILAGTAGCLHLD